MSKKILAIGGAVIKTAHDELREIIERDEVEILIHNGGSVFHDFQRVTEKLDSHSYPIDELMKDYSCLESASNLVWDWVAGGNAPSNSVTRICDDKKIPVLLFTGYACDFWQMYGEIEEWEMLASNTFQNFEDLIKRFKKPFHYICMGSAVIHPEVFIKAIAAAKPKKFKADVVDFLDMYRPKTRIAKYGNYHKMEHKKYLVHWLKGIKK